MTLLYCTIERVTQIMGLTLFKLRSSALISACTFQFFHKQFYWRSIVQQFLSQTVTPVFYFYQMLFRYTVYPMPFGNKSPRYAVMSLYRPFLIGRIGVSVIH